MKKLTITRQQACRFILAQQGLWPPYGLEGKPGILSYIRRVGCIQFDPLNVAGYNQDLVLQARIADFKPFMLQELLYRERKLEDGWDKNMSIYCTEDRPYFRRSREAARQKLGAASGPVLSVLPQVRKALEDRGPLSSAGLDFNQTVDWPWTPTRLSRAVLESMYFWGELVIHHRAGTRKIYDFAHRHLPEELLQAPDPNETEDQYRDWYVLRRMGGIGLLFNRSGDAWLGISGINSRDRSSSLMRLIGQGKVMEVWVEGIEQPLYMRSEDAPRLDSILECDCPTSLAAILAPLDNLLWDRRLVKELFAFDYRWEVYKPAAQRQFGYYVLPVLYGDRFVARFEPARDKSDDALIIKNWWWEPGINQSEEMRSGLAGCFKRFTGYLGAGGIRVDSRVAKREGLGFLARQAGGGRRQGAGKNAR